MELRNPSLEYLEREYNEFVKKYTGGIIKKGRTAELEKKETHLLLTIREEKKQSIVFPVGLPEDCWRLIADYAMEYSECWIRLDWLTPRHNTRAYPFLPLIWTWEGGTTNMEHAESWMKHWKYKVALQNGKRQYNVCDEIVCFVA